MLRLFLGLFLVMTLGLVLALQTVERTFDALLDYQMQDYNREAVRGQAWALGQQLRDLDGPAREQQLETIRPHYGLGLTLVDASELALSDEEKAELAKGLLVIRDKYTQYISAIDEGPQLLSIRLPAEPSLMPFYIAAAYLMIAVLIGIVLFSGCARTGAIWRNCAWPPSVSAITTCRCAFNCRNARTFAIWPNTSI